MDKKTQMVSSILEVLGMVLMVVGAVLIDWRFGICMAGALVLLFGYSMGAES